MPRCCERPSFESWTGRPLSLRGPGPKGYRRAVAPFRKTGASLKLTILNDKGRAISSDAKIAAQQTSP